MGKVPAICQSPGLHLTSKIEAVVCRSNIRRDFQKDKVRYLGHTDCQDVHFLSVCGSVKRHLAQRIRLQLHKIQGHRKEHSLIAHPVYFFPNMDILLSFHLTSIYTFYACYHSALYYLQTVKTDTFCYNSSCSCCRKLFFLSSCQDHTICLFLIAAGAMEHILHLPHARSMPGQEGRERNEKKMAFFAV